MTKFTVVEDLDVFEDLLPGSGMCLKGSVCGQFLFQGGEEAFGHRVVPAIAFSTHAHDCPVRFEHFSMRLCCILATSIAVV